MIYPTNHTKAALMLLAGTHGLLLQLGNVLEAGDCEQHTAASVIANAQDQLGSAASLLQANPDSAALRTLAAAICPIRAGLEMFRIGFAGDSPVCDLSTSRKALYMLANEVQTLANMLEDLTTRSEATA